MAFQINKTLAIRLGPFQHSIDMIILNKVEELLTEAKQTPIRLFSVDYKEVKPNGFKAVAGYRYFRILEAYNNRDK